MLAVLVSQISLGDVGKAIREHLLHIARRLTAKCRGDHVNGLIAVGHVWLRILGVGAEESTEEDGTAEPFYSVLSSQGRYDGFESRSDRLSLFALRTDIEVL